MHSLDSISMLIWHNIYNFLICYDMRVSCLLTTTLNIYSQLNPRGSHLVNLTRDNCPRIFTPKKWNLRWMALLDTYYILTPRSLGLFCFILWWGHCGTYVLVKCKRLLSLRLCFYLIWFFFNLNMCCLCTCCIVI